jgi:hypothetical protein
VDVDVDGSDMIPLKTGRGEGYGTLVVEVVSREFFIANKLQRGKR